MSITLAFTAAMLFGIGTYLVMQRKLSRIIIGLGLLSHGANVLLMMSGRRGTPPLIGSGDQADFSDPMPQALALTAIVITFAVTALLLALAYRSWLLTSDDEVRDDVADRVIAAGGFEDKEVTDLLAEEKAARTAGRRWIQRDCGSPGTVSQLLALPIVLPLIGAAISIVAGRSRTAQRVISISILTAVLGIAIAIFVEVDRNGTAIANAGGWTAPMGITLVADRLAALMLVVGALMLLAVLVYAIGQPGAERNHVGFQSVYLVLTAGVSASFLTGDLFNLFVAFEMLLTASYVLMTLGGRPEQVRSGMTYVVISLLASALFVTALALLYMATGTVNMADLSVKMAELSPGVRTAFATLLLVVFGIKAALFPLYFWLPDSYPTAPSPVTAIFAGLLTKVGVYAIIRTQTLLFPESSRPTTLILVIAGATMVVGVLGAIAQDDVKRILSFNIVCHMGYMVMGLGFYSVAGLAGALFYTVHHIVANTTLFLTGGLIEHAGGSSRLSQLGGMVRTAPVIAALFLIPALNLAGVPPLTGFIAKFALVDAGFAGDHYMVTGVALLVSLLSFYSLLKIWSGAFWNPAEDPIAVPIHPQHTGRLGGPRLMVLPTAFLAGVSIAMAAAAGPLYSFSERTAGQLLDPTGYLHVVLGS